MGATSDKTDRFAHLTAAQRDAIRTTDCSLLVSAAAGSGKTTVLAERCAYLVCDLPADQRCGVAELLVVTFTDAAAGEMRTRIGNAIRQRMTENPKDAYLREQLYLLDSASISTIHSFCRTIVQKWFPQAGIDPQAAVLNGDEAEMLRREVLDDLFREAYGREDDFGNAFRALVDEYGAGEDWQIGEVALSVHNFINSLPDPHKWLADAVTQVDANETGSIAAQIDRVQAERIRTELDRQIEFAEFVVATIRKAWPCAVNRAEAAEEHLFCLKAWRDQLQKTPATWEQAADSIRAYCFDRLKPRPRNLCDEDVAAFENATDLFNKTKKLFCDRLQEKLCRFTAAEYREGLARIAPFVRTMTELVGELDHRYSEAKSAQAALDFNDLQRGAYRLLADNGNPHRPSAIARQLQQQYRYVLVDEFQDVDPLQESILRLVSREMADPPAGNLFTVGDIKQSIYRFRLAEPKLFTGRADEFDKAGALGRVIHLQENFRSRQGIIDTVNEIFRRLMSRDFGGSEYDQHAELHAGAAYPSAADGPVFDKPAIEMHLLEPITQATKPDDAEEPSESTADSPDEELEGIEREAYLIAQRIRSWMGLEPGSTRRHVVAKPDKPGLPPKTRPIEYADIVILLRAVMHKAAPIAEILRRMGIPVRLEAADNQLDSTEFRDIYSLLQVLDNRQQDIPLASVLRSPLLGDALNETDLLKIRLVDRSVPFHVAVAMYVNKGTDASLRDRITALLASLDRFRTRIQREPVADVLWDIYEQTHYLSFVSGLPDGVQRKSHLVQMHELARQFGRFSKQGLRRFLRFLDEMVAQERGGPPAGAGTASENAVRIMTIHASKGLEFPVVILPDLQKRFNLTDTRGMALVDRQLGLALQVADPDRRVRYPTLLHHLAGERGQQESLSEELRVLYVALTRAREHLVLIGRCPLAHIEAARNLGGGGLPRVPRMQLESASCVLDWMLPALGRMPAGTVDWSERSVDQSPASIAVRVYERDQTDAWRIPPAQRPETLDTLAAIGRLEPLADDEPIARIAAVDQSISALSFQYPGLELTTMSARATVSDLKRAWQANVDPDERTSLKPMKPVTRPAFLADGPVKLDAAGRGTALHRFMQLLDLERPCDAGDLERQQRELVESGRMNKMDMSAVEIESVLWFFQTPLGQTVRERADQVQREVPFISRVQPDRLDPHVHPRDHRDVVLVRGVVDLLIAGRNELVIADYKTDAVDYDACQARAEGYRTQLAYYADALTAAYNLPVAHQYLVFMHARRIVEFAPAKGV